MMGNKATYEQRLAFTHDVSTSKEFMGSEMCLAHGVSKGATAAMKEMGLLKTQRGQGCVYIGPILKDEDDLKRLASAVMERSCERQRRHRKKLGLPHVSKSLFDKLQDTFTTRQAEEIGKRIGISRTTVRRILKKDSRIVRNRHGHYSKMSMRHGGINITHESASDLASKKKSTKHVGILRRLLRWIW